MKKILISLTLVLLCAVLIPMGANAETWGDYEYTDNGGLTCTITNYTGTVKNIAIPDTINGLTVTGIDDNAFKAKGLKSVVLPANLISIGEYAFAANKLSGIIIPNTVRVVDNSAFRSNKLTSVTLSSGLSRINNSAFRNNKLASVTIPAGVTRIYDSAFRDNGEMTSVVFEANSTINRIDNNAFRSNGLTSLAIPESLTRIHDNAFRGNNLTSITYEGTPSLYRIDGSAFRGNNLTTLTLPESITRIDGFAFGSNDLTTVTIPSSVKNIGGGAFNDNAITTVNGNPSNGIIYARNNDGTDNTAKITSYGGSADVINFIPSNVTIIGNNSFRGNELTSITIPYGVTRIYNSAFRDNDLNTVSVPQSVISVGAQAFRQNNFSTFMLPVGSGTWETSGNGTYSGGDSVSVSINSVYTRINEVPNIISTVNASDTAVTNLNTAYTLDLSTIFEDGNSDPMTYEVNIDSAGYVPAAESYSYPANTAGTYVFEFIAYDGYEYSTDIYTVTLTVNIIPNRKSSVQATATATVAVNNEYTLDLTTIFEDSDGDTLTFDVTVGASGYAACANPYSYTPSAVGDTVLTFQAKDAHSTSSETYQVTLTAENTVPNRKVSVPASVLAGVHVNTEYTLDLSTIFEDNNNDSLTYEVNIDSIGYVSTAQNYSFTPDEVRDYELVFKAKDAVSESTDTYTVTLTSDNASPNRISSVNATAAETVDVNTAYTVDLSTIFEDGDGDSLTYEVNTDSAGYIAASQNYSFTPVSAGSYELVFRAKDSISASTDTYTVNLTAVNGTHTLTYDANGGSGSASEMHTGMTIFSLHDGEGFTKDGYLIDGWEIDGAPYLLTGLYQMPNADKTAYATWAIDTDSDGVSDDDENIYGSAPDDPTDKPESGTVRVTIYNQDSTPFAGCTVVIHSTPRTAISDVNGQVVFNDVILGRHTVTLSDGTNPLGTYVMTFSKGTDNTYTIIDDASDDSVGEVSATVTDSFMMMDMTIQQNAMSYWELSGADITTEADPLPNPRTGDTQRARLWIIIAMIPALLAGSGALFIRSKSKRICTK